MLVEQVAPDQLIVLILKCIHSHSSLSPVMVNLPDVLPRKGRDRKPMLPISPFDTSPDLATALSIPTHCLVTSLAAADGRAATLAITLLTQPGSHLARSQQISKLSDLRQRWTAATSAAVPYPRSCTAPMMTSLYIDRIEFFSSESSPQGDPSRDSMLHHEPSPDDRCDKPVPEGDP